MSNTPKIDESYLDILKRSPKYDEIMLLMADLDQRTKDEEPGRGILKDDMVRLLELISEALGEGAST